MVFLPGIRTHGNKAGECWSSLMDVYDTKIIIINMLYWRKRFKGEGILRSK